MPRSSVVGCSDANPPMKTMPNYQDLNAKITAADGWPVLFAEP